MLDIYTILLLAFIVVSIKFIAPDDHVTADVTEKKPRPSPLKLEPSQPLGLGDFLRK